MVTKPPGYRSQYSFVRGREIAAPVKIIFHLAFGKTFLQIFTGGGGVVIMTRGNLFWELLRVLKHRAQTFNSSVGHSKCPTIKLIKPSLKFITSSSLPKPSGSIIQNSVRWPRFRFFGAENRTETIASAETRGGRFVVKLPALRQIRFIVFKIINLEKRRCAFAGGGRENRRVGEDETVVVEKIPGRFDDRVPDFQNGVLFARANP